MRYSQTPNRFNDMNNSYIRPPSPIISQIIYPTDHSYSLQNKIPFPNGSYFPTPGLIGNGSMVYKSNYSNNNYYNNHLSFGNCVRVPNSLTNNETNFIVPKDPRLSVNNNIEIRNSGIYEPKIVKSRALSCSIYKNPNDANNSIRITKLEEKKKEKSFISIKKVLKNFGIK